MSYDDKCWDLAGDFLAGETDLATETNRRRLAQRIQDTVEEFISQEVTRRLKELENE